VLRGLLLFVLVLGVAGFGICSFCGGVMGVSMLLESKQSSRDMAWLGFGFGAVGAVLAWLCWRGVRALRTPPSASSDAAAPPPAP
jgi:hypothetical protein